MVSMQNLQARLKFFYASSILHFYRKKLRFDQLRLNHEVKFATYFLLIWLVSILVGESLLKGIVDRYFTSTELFSVLRSLLGGIGAALIGATAIAFSLVVFAMQINVERMPHGLFRKLSSDKKLLGSFLGSFIIAFIIASMSMIKYSNYAIHAIVVAIGGTLSILLLFLYSYRRALQLINPIEQLSIMSNASRRDLRKWNHLAEKAIIVMSETSPPNVDSDVEKSQFNVAKASFFKVNSDWNKTAIQAIHYAISYAKRFAEQGDYEVTEYAFECIMRVNAAYCSAKHGTFVGKNPFLDIPDATDGFINTSLELMRQTMQTALVKGDERLAENTLRGISSLYGVYLMIEYPGREKSKHHASLAARYMESAVESVAPHNKPDLMMEGIRLMGKSAIVALDYTEPTEIISLAGKIAMLSSVGVISKNYQPVTLTAFEQLAEITYQLLIKGKHDIRYPIEKLRSNVTESAKRFLETQDSPLNSLHQYTLGPYFSSTSFSSFRSKLTALVNQLIEAPADNLRAGEIIANIETWADQLYASQKELLLLSVHKRSSFIFDVISWAVVVSELLNALSNAPSCTPYLKDELRKHANLLISTLSWLPDEQESVAFAENFSLTENLFEAALSGFNRDCIEFYENCKQLLIGWAKKGGRYESGWGILDKSVQGLIALVINERSDAAVAGLKSQFQVMLGSDNAPTQEERTRAATRLVKSISSIRRHTYMHSRIDYMLSKLKYADVSKLIYEFAEILAPDLQFRDPSGKGGTKT
ncbi:TPA: hypothetical protein ND538_001397 [Serratia marcescens]|nr:hypothetical protein [Serratia marcescens]